MHFRRRSDKASHSSAPTQSKNAPRESSEPVSMMWPFGGEQCHRRHINVKKAKASQRAVTPVISRTESAANIDNCLYGRKESNCGFALSPFCHRLAKKRIASEAEWFLPPSLRAPNLNRMPAIWRPTRDADLIPLRRRCGGAQGAPPHRDSIAKNALRRLGRRALPTALGGVGIGSVLGCGRANDGIALKSSRWNGNAGGERTSPEPASERARPARAFLPRRPAARLRFAKSEARATWGRAATGG